MKRVVLLMAAAVVAVSLFAGLVHAVLVAARVSEPAKDTVYGSTPQRTWATMAVSLALVGVASGGLALNRPTHRNVRRLGSWTAIVSGLIGGINGALVLSSATGGPGSGNGVVGGAMALVLGLTAVALGGSVLLRSRRAQRALASRSSSEQA